MKRTILNWARRDCTAMEITEVFQNEERFSLLSNNLDRVQYEITGK